MSRQTELYKFMSSSIFWTPLCLIIHTIFWYVMHMFYQGSQVGFEGKGELRAVLSTE